MDVLEELDAIIEEVNTARNVRFSASAMINKQALLDRLKTIREGLPEEMAHARSLMSERDQLMDALHGQRDQIVAEAEAERDRLVGKTEIAQAANRQAQKIVEAAKHKAAELRAEAEDYVDSRLAGFEVVLHKTLSVVTKGRDSLRGRLDATGQRVPADAPGELADLKPDSTGEIQMRRV